MSEQDNRLFEIDLQLFAEGEEVPPTYGGVESDIRALLEEPTETAVPPVEGAEPTESAPVAPESDPVPPTEEPPAEPAPEEAAPTEPVASDPMANPVVQELMKVVQQQQETLKQQSELVQSFMQNSMTNNAPQPTPEVMKTPEEMEAEKEALMERFYANPMDVLNEFANKATEPLREKLTAYEENEAWNKAIGGISADAEKYPEFENVRQRMSDILFKERPYLLNGGDKARALDDAYAIAVSEIAKAAPPVQQPAQYTQPGDALKDPEFIKQILSNPEAMKLIAAEQAKLIQAQGQQVPPMSPSSGATNVAPYIKDKPNNWNELDADIKKSLNQGLI